MRILLARKQLTVQQFFALYFAALIAIALVYLGVTGRLHPLFALGGAVLPFLGRLAGFAGRAFTAANLFRQFRGMAGSLGGTGPSTGAGPRVSEITTRYLYMTLNHDSGEMDGKILAGKWEGQMLSTLAVGELKQLLGACQDDGDSVNLLEAYLDREHPDWHDGEERQAAAGSSNLDESQALEILGLPADAIREDIIAAHRRLMQKMHPDRGGSTYLAARINEAKDLLLKHREYDS